jgi:hypothetical protein
MSDKKVKKDIIIDKPEEPSTFVEENSQESVTEVPAPQPEQSETFVNNETTTTATDDIDDPTKIIKFETPIGTEIEMTAQEARRLLSPEGKEESKFAKDMNEILVNVSQERLDDITGGLKKGILKLQYVKGGKVIPNNIDYVPITYGQNKKVNRIMKLARLLREDINATLEGKLDIKDLRTKYKEIIDEEVEAEELKNKAYVNEMVGNFVIAQKAKIYWGIEENIEDYVLSDLVLIIGLYERRNNYTNT